MCNAPLGFADSCLAVWHGIMRPYQDYRLVGGRFNSEFGMQSYPHMNTVNKFVTDDLEKHPQSLTVDFHNKCKTHERRLATYVRENFRASDSSLEVRSHTGHLND